MDLFHQINEKYYPWCYLGEFEAWAKERGMSVEDAYDFVLNIIPERYKKKRVMLCSEKGMALAFWASALRGTY